MYYIADAFKKVTTPTGFTVGAPQSHMPALIQIWLSTGYSSPLAAARPEQSDGHEAAAAATQVQVRAGPNDRPHMGEPCRHRRQPSRPARITGKSIATPPGRSCRRRAKTDRGVKIRCSLLQTVARDRGRQIPAASFTGSAQSFSAAVSGNGERGRREGGRWRRRRLGFGPPSPGGVV